MSTQNKTADIAPAGGSDIDNVQLSGQAGQSLLGTLVNRAYQMATGKRILPQGQDPATAFVNDQAFRQFQHSIAAGSQSGAPMLANLIQGVGRTMGMSDTPEWRGIQMQLAQTFSQYLPMVRQVFPQIDMAYGMHNPMAWGSDLAHLPQFKDLARINDPGFAAKTQRLHELLYPGTPGDWDANHHFSEGLSSGLLSAGISKGLIRPDASAEEMAKFVRNMQAYTLPMYQKTLDSGYYLSGHEGGSALLDLFQRSTPAGVGWNPQQIAEEGLRRRWHEMQGGRAQGFFSHNNMSMDPDDPMRTPANVDALWESTEGRASSSMIANQLGALRYAQRFAKNPDAVEGVFKSFAQNPQSIIPMNVMIGAMRQSGLDAQTAAMMAATPGSYMYMTPEDHHLLPLAQGAEIGERMRAMGAKNFDWNDSHTAAIGNTVGAQYGFQPGMVRYLTPNMAQQRYAYEQYALEQAQKALPGFGAKSFLASRSAAANRPTAVPSADKEWEPGS